MYEVHRVFTPDDPVLRTLAQQGMIVFTAGDGWCVVHQTWDGQQAVAMIELLTWESPAVQDLLQAVEEWRQANRLTVVMVRVQRPEQRQVLAQLGLQTSVRTALVAVEFPEKHIEKEERPIIVKEEFHGHDNVEGTNVGGTEAEVPDPPRRRSRRRRKDGESHLSSVPVEPDQQGADGDSISGDNMDRDEHPIPLFVPGWAKRV